MPVELLAAAVVYYCYFEKYKEVLELCNICFERHSD